MCWTDVCVHILRHTAWCVHGSDGRAAWCVHGSTVHDARFGQMHDSIVRDARIDTSTDWSRRTYGLRTG